MLERDQAAGVDVFDDGGTPRLPGPPERVEPRLPVVIPPVDWRQEELERAKRQAADGAVQLESEASLRPTPAKRQKRSKSTPRLDAVKAWRAGR
jgi:hypothetical protein